MSWSIITIRSCRNVTQNIAQRLQIYNAKGITTEQAPTWDVQIRHFDELFASAEKQFGQEFLDDYHQAWQNISRKIDESRESIQNGSYQLIEKVLDYIPDRSPVVAIAFLPPYYPNASNRNYPDLPEKVASIGQAVDSFSRNEWGERYRSMNYFMQISDMSFASFHDIDDAIATIGRNMPMWNKYYGQVFVSKRTLSMPVVNIGPWGKDLHKFGERVFRPDLEEKTFAILEHAILNILEDR